MKKITLEEKDNLAREFNITRPHIDAVIAVESGGIGFDSDTKKIIIQFEPKWFKRKAPYTPSGKWSLNKVDVQAKEWLAFNDAFSKDPKAAMESTSIGMMQVMGFHWKLLGFKSVDAMWDYAKESEYNQVRLGLLFIKSNHKMYKALKSGVWWQFAFFYNGEEYAKFKYNTRLKHAFDTSNRHYF